MYISYILLIGSTRAWRCGSKCRAGSRGPAHVAAGIDNVSASDIIACVRIAIQFEHIQLTNKRINITFDIYKYIIHCQVPASRPVATPVRAPAAANQHAQPVTRPLCPAAEQRLVQAMSGANAPPVMKAMFAKSPAAVRAQWALHEDPVKCEMNLLQQMRIAKVLLVLHCVGC